MERPEREQLERRLEEINKKLGILDPQILGGEPPKEIDSNELFELHKECEEIKKKLGMGP